MGHDSRRAKGRKMMNVAALPFGIGAAVYFAIRLPGSRRREMPYAPSKMVITAPTLGIPNLAGRDAISSVDADRRAFGDLFSCIAEGTDAPPLCDALLIYCQIGVDGRLENTSQSLREVIRDAHAKIVVVASENQGGLSGSYGEGEP
jgi:hypothetical protein